MALPKFGPLANASDGTKKTLKPVLIGIIAVLLGAFGLTASNNDWNLGSIFSGQSVKDSKVQMDEKGNILRDQSGNVLTKVMRDKAGNVVTDGSGKATDEYNCKDFSTQSEAQNFFVKAGGPNKDVNRLDGNNDSVACQELPKGN